MDPVGGRLRPPTCPKLPKEKNAIVDYSVFLRLTEAFGIALEENNSFSAPEARYCVVGRLKNDPSTLAVVIFELSK